MKCWIYMGDQKQLIVLIVTRIKILNNKKKYREAYQTVEVSICIPPTLPVGSDRGGCRLRCRLAVHTLIGHIGKVQRTIVDKMSPSAILVDPSARVEVARGPCREVSIVTHTFGAHCVSTVLLKPQLCPVDRVCWFSISERNSTVLI